MRALRSLSVASVVCLALWGGTPALASPGDLDPTFGDQGMATAVFPIGAYATDVAIQPDGAIVAVGAAAGNSGTGEFAVARFLPDGTLDPTFGDGGLVTTPIRGGHGDEARAVALQPNGRIVAAGADSWERFAVVRYLPDGSLDPSFGPHGNGIVRTNFQPGDDIAWDVALQGDGRIVAIGAAGYGQVGFEIARYRRGGALDRTFAHRGKLTLRYGGANARAVAIQPDGRIVVSGYNMFGPALARFLPDGTLDPSFGHDGVVRKGTVPVGGFSLALQPNGRILVGGDADIFRVGITRVLPDGRLDTTFGDHGETVLEIGSGEQNLMGIEVQPDRRIVALGHVGPHEGGTAADWQSAVVRFRPHGALDRSFGVGGLATTAVPEGFPAFGLARQDDGKLVAVGGLGGTDAFVAMRFLA